MVEKERPKRLWVSVKWVRRLNMLPEPRLRANTASATKYGG
jgi:hypothetical protein